ncbi:MAG: glycosyltransferase, partial [Bacteroidetes bacterium]|nr:glycosyltransferase [Bacteroidota bacterium]
MRKICIIKSKRVPLDLEKSIDGGTINFIYIVKTLQKDKNNEITILTRNEYNDAVTEIVIVNEIKMVLLPYEKSFDTQIMIRDYQEGKSFCLSVNNYLESNSFHIIHTHHWSSAIQLKINNTFWIHTPHLLAYAKKHYIDFLCPNYIIDEERNILENSDKIIALSSAEKFDMLKNYFIDEKKIFVIPNGISELFFKKNTNQRNFSNQI